MSMIDQTPTTTRTDEAKNPENGSPVARVKPDSGISERRANTLLYATASAMKGLEVLHSIAGDYEDAATVDASQVRWMVETITRDVHLAMRCSDHCEIDQDLEDAAQ